MNSHTTLRKAQPLVPVAAAVILVTAALFTSSCRHNPTGPDDTLHHHDSTGVNDSTKDSTGIHDSTGVGDSTRDSVYRVLHNGKLFTFTSINFGLNGTDRDVTGYTESIADWNTTAYGYSNTFTLRLPLAFGSEQRRRIEANGDLQMYCSIYAPTGGMPVGAQKTSLGSQQDLNRWILWPMSSTSGRHQVLDRVISTPNEYDWVQTIWMETLDTTTVRTCAGPVKVVRYIETDTTGEMAYGRQFVSGNTARFIQWYAPSLGVFVRSEQTMPFNMGNRVLVRDSLVAVSY